ncbi:MAG: thioredoxin [Clostridia bacterium]|nr:thioredoxin [Clostridia bacterium]MBO7737395.1 thioredoxin [Clostridia bacterium]MBR6506138.1 thioredoxin [Clostridia bacterium]
MSVIHVDSFNFEEVVLKSEKTVLIDFWATWCGPCRMIAPIIEEIAAEHPEYAVCKIDVDKAGELAKQFGITNIPTLIVMKNGETVNKSVGVIPKEKILKLLEA